MGAALTIRDDLTPEALRRRARHEPNRRASLRMLAVANALEGMSRAEAARLAGMERQALRDAVVRYNAEGLAGLHDRPKPGRPERLSEAEQAALAARVFAGPDPERDGVSAWTRADLARWLEARFGKAFHPSSLSRVLRRLDLSRQKTRPAHPEADPAAQERFRKKGSVIRSGRRPRHVPANGSRSGSWTRPGSARRVGSATAGGSGAGGRRGGATDGSSGPTCSPPPSPRPARASPSSCPRRPPRR
jgi:transposase